MCSKISSNSLSFSPIKQLTFVYKTETIVHAAIHRSPCTTSKVKRDTLNGSAGKWSSINHELFNLSESSVKKHRKSAKVNRATAPSVRSPILSFVVPSYRSLFVNNHFSCSLNRMRIARHSVKLFS